MWGTPEMRLVIDCETNALRNPTKVHCIVAKDIDDGETYTFVGKECQEEFPRFIRRGRLFIGHNCIAFDWPILRKLCGVHTVPEHVFDTLVVSRLLEFTFPGGHSLDAWGQRPVIGLGKQGKNITDWSEFTVEMLERCVSDVEINAKLYHHLTEKARIKYKDVFKNAIQIEHQIAWICQEMHENGFGFDKEKAKNLYEEISTKVQEIDRELDTAFPPKVETVQLKRKVKQIVTPFNPGSPKQIVERLEGFWKPTEKTDSGKSWKISEKNLATLSPEAPRAAQRLVERLMLASRLRTLDQWFDAYNEKTGRVHAEFSGLGAWTHRMSHSRPNLGNVAAPKSIKYHGAVLAELATSYGGRMRELWCVKEYDDDETPTWLVGCDAEGIQLRIFGHYINDEEFIRAVVQGKKEDGTDPHSLNARILECSRDAAKTFIYAFLLGAGDGKIGEILGCSKRGGAAAKKRFINAIPGLAKLKKEDIPRDAQRGHIVGFDGRLVKVDSEHKVMAAYLQTGEAVIMKHANVLWREESKRSSLAFRQVNFVHDEWQTELKGTEEEAHVLGRIQAASIERTGRSFGLRCPMAGNYTIGKNWKETH